MLMPGRISLVKGIAARRAVILYSLALAGVAFLAFYVRCVHLLNPDHFYILSTDSYFFHWVAQGVMAGNPPPVPPGSDNAYLLHSGLAYPLAYLAEAVSSVFSLSSEDALAAVSKFVPPILGLVSTAVIYLGAARICDRRVGVFAGQAGKDIRSAEPS